MGTGMQSDTVYLIDFGLSKEYRDPNTYKHIPFKTNIGLTGTASFASINSHLGLELGRRDDLESLAYVLIYFLRGDLPWLGLSSEPRNILKRKQRTKSSTLCRGLPAEFATFLEYSRSLSFEAIPDYGYVSGLFKGLSSSREGLEIGAFDWDRAESADDVPPRRVSDLGQRKRNEPQKRREG
jgi:serine/threonine protein kinase